MYEQTRIEHSQGPENNLDFKLHLTFKKRASCI